MTRRPRLSDIADRLGVSTATVSRALSGQGYVRDDLAQRIRACAAELGYGPARSLDGQRVILAASREAMVDFERNQFTLHVLEGLSARAESLGVRIENRTLVSPAEEAALRAEASTEGLAGVLMLTVDDDLLELARALPVPVVLINGDDPDMRLSSVAPCNRSAAALATQHLRGLGHRRIAFLTRAGRRTILRRQEGWRDAMGADHDPALVIGVDDWRADLAEAVVTEWLAQGGQATAILATGDVLAAGAIMALRRAGIVVPRDMSVMGIDGLPQSRLVDPPLSSVAIPMREVGAAALDLLHQTLQAAEAGTPLPARRVELACALVERASTAVAGQ